MVEHGASSGLPLMHIYDDIDRLRLEIEDGRPLDAGLIRQTGEYYHIGHFWSSNVPDRSGHRLVISESKTI